VPEPFPPEGPKEGRRPKRKLETTAGELAGIEPKRVNAAVQKVVEFGQLHDSAPLDVTLDALVNTRDWILELFTLLWERDAASQERCLKFLATDQTDSENLRNLAMKNDYATLNKVIAPGQVLYNKLMGG